MAYVPPHLRNRASNASSASDASQRASSGASRPSAPSSPFFSDSELKTALGGAYHLNTLTHVRDSDGFAAVVIHEGQHREWAEKKVLCKTHLDVLRSARGKDPADLPLFMEMPRKGSPRYDFHGWWRIADVQWLDPDTDGEEILKRLEKKFEPAAGAKSFRGGRGGGAGRGGFARSEASWKESLRTHWALVTFEQNKERKDPFVPLPPPAKGASGEDTPAQSDKGSGSTGQAAGATSAPSVQKSTAPAADSEAPSVGADDAAQPETAKDDSLDAVVGVAEEAHE
ncbi:hypothetical protein DFJ74DRAFT_633853 [Hyaloraphidium curvatum]|nr:hypothetical protein DFJ74DRAFT_633853 [Hyaloraphidium curvatum]